MIFSDKIELIKQVIAESNKDYGNSFGITPNNAVKNLQSDNKSIIQHFKIKSNNYKIQNRINTNNNLNLIKESHSQLSFQTYNSDEKYTILNKIKEILNAS